MFDRPEVRVALPGLIADTVADPELHKLMIARLAGNLTAFESRFGQRRREDELPLLAEVVRDERFVKGDVDTSFLDRFMAERIVRRRALAETES